MEKTIVEENNEVKTELKKEARLVPDSNRIKEGDAVLLWFERKDISYLVEVVKGRKFPIHCGKPLDMDEWIGREFGEKVICDHGHGYFIKPTMEDYMMKASEKAGLFIQRMPPF